jgi:hypothetical protein
MPIETRWKKRGAMVNSDAYHENRHEIKWVYDKIYFEQDIAYDRA